MYCTYIDSLDHSPFPRRLSHDRWPKKLCHAFCITTWPPRGRRSNETYPDSLHSFVFVTTVPAFRFYRWRPPGQESKVALQTRPIVSWNNRRLRRWKKIEWAITISLSTTVSPTWSNDKRLLTTRSLRNDNWIFLPANPAFWDTKGIKGGRCSLRCVKLRYRFGIDDDRGVACRKNLVFLINLTELPECLIGRIVGISLVGFLNFSRWSWKSASLKKPDPKESARLDPL